MSQITEKLAEMANRSDNYAYVPLADAKKLLNMKVNVIAKVSEVGLPKRTRGTDFCIILKMVDFSSPAPAISVNIFAAKKENLPSVKSAGDIICLHRVLAKSFNGDVYIFFNKTSSSFALFDGKPHMGLIPYQASTNTYHSTGRACELIVQLRTLPLKTLSVQQTDAGLATTLSLLRNIERGKLFDLICKVLYVHEASQDEWMLFVWDGTDTPPTVFETNLDMEKEKPCLLRPEQFPLPREILCSFPCVGTILRVTCKKFYENINHWQHGDRWLKLYNVSCELQSEIWIGVMNTSSSKVFILSEEDDNVKDRIRIYSERLASQIQRVPMSSSLQTSEITEIDHQDLPYLTLMESLTNAQVAHMCQCIVRVTSSCPWRGKDLRSLVDGHYRLRVTLEDPTARVHAYIIRDEAVNFFGGYLGYDELTKKMMKLLGMKEPSTDESEREPMSRNPPWIKCCLWSYYLDKDDKLGSRRYRVYGTSMLS